MKALTLISAFLGGAIVGCGTAFLYAPEKGADVRAKILEMGNEAAAKIKELLQKNGIKISDSEVDALVAELAGKADSENEAE